MLGDHLLGFWDKSCDSTLTPPPPAKKKNPATIIGVPKTARYLKPLKDVVATEAHHTDQLASKARSSLQEHIGAVASSLKCTLEDNDGPGYLFTSSSKRARSIDPDEDDDVKMGDGNDLTSLSGDDVDDDIAEAAGVEEDVLDNISLDDALN
ncbi:hypothetical protein PQX77_017536 [Marasmius sp. AFHP31]|nr:hypothetical protein PQX77_017536 [Marasmius sp. AFHP31]